MGTKHIASISWAWARITFSAGLLPASGQGGEHRVMFSRSSSLWTSLAYTDTE